MKWLKEFSANKKFLVSLLGLGVLIIVFLIIYSLRLRTVVNVATLPNYNVTTGNTDKADKSLQVVGVTPAEKSSSTIDTFEIIYFTISDPVDLQSIRVNVTPSVDVKILPHPLDEKSFGVMPLGLGWEFDKEYRVQLIELSSTNNKALNNPYLYRYKNTLPAPEDIILPY